MKDFFAKQLICFFIVFFLAACWFNTQAQIPTGYYDGTENLYGNALKQKLHTIIKGHTVHSYNQLWEDFRFTDKKPNGKVWDMYSDKPGGTPAYEYTFGGDQCGNYNSEADCYNREHSWPKSWFDDKAPMNSDLGHLIPTDGYVNNRRSNYPFGEVGSANWTSTNGSKVGECITSGYNGVVFEPINEYKGDIARMMFYMTVRYYTEDNNWSTSDMTNKSTILPWALTMLRRWHQDDPVSQKEMDRNNAMYNIQKNRNPFIDHPEFVEYIWNPSIGFEDYEEQIQFSVWPNPVSISNSLNVSWTSGVTMNQIIIVDLSGRIVYQQPVESNNVVIEAPDLNSGFYFIQLTDNKQVYATSKLIIQ